MIGGSPENHCILAITGATLLTSLVTLYTCHRMRQDTAPARSSLSLSPPPSPVSLASQGTPDIPDTPTTPTAVTAAEKEKSGGCLLWTLIRPDHASSE